MCKRRPEPCRHYNQGSSNDAITHLRVFTQCIACISVFNIIPTRYTKPCTRLMSCRMQFLFHQPLTSRCGWFSHLFLAGSSRGGGREAKGGPGDGCEASSCSRRPAARLREAGASVRTPCVRPAATVCSKVACYSLNAPRKACYGDWCTHK